jgi:hypothetical protein
MRKNQNKYQEIKPAEHVLEKISHFKSVKEQIQQLLSCVAQINGPRKSNCYLPYDVNVFSIKQALEIIQNILIFPRLREQKLHSQHRNNFTHKDWHLEF